MADIWKALGTWIDYFLFQEGWRTILLYQEVRPLLFTHLFFWVFLFFVLAGHSLLYSRIAFRNAYLFLASLYFYYKTSGICVLILLFSTVSDFWIAHWIDRSCRLWVRRLGVALSVFINLFTLSFFKYAYFFTETVNQLFGTHFVVFNWFAYWANAALGTHYEVGEILLPVGISFYTFQTISYTVDVYRGHVKPLRNILDFGFYVSFFPQLVAGPIVRASEFVPQIHQPYMLTQEDFGYAMYMICKGLLKKLVFGDYLAILFIDRVFDRPTLFTGFENLMAAFGYSLQVYSDFSGYTDIAIGVARLFGFRLPQNFNYPYKAKNVREFWQRWHMSLSRWLKDYLYIPLGGNRRGSLASLILTLVIALVLFLMARKVWVRIAVVVGLILLGLLYWYRRTRRHVVTNINIMITMLLGGLWHGASWQFVMWGGINGIGLLIYRYWRKISPWEASTHPLVVAWRVLLTFCFITFTRFWFRAPDTQTVDLMFHQILHQFGWELIPQIVVAHWKFFALWCAGMLLHWLPLSWKQRLQTMWEEAPLWAHPVLLAAVAVLAYQAAAAGLQPFIYFQF